jgi:Xaa-Pro aminopeptidase
MIVALVFAAGLQSGLTADLPASVYAARRAHILSELGGCVAIIAAQGQVEGVTESFRQDGDFFWLTGINEPNAWLLFTPKAKYDKVTLFLAPRDPEHERWTGPRDAISPTLLAKYGVDRVFRGRPDAAALAAAEATDCVALIAPAYNAKDDRLDVELSRGISGAYGLRIVYKRELLARLRSAHSTEEIERIRRAITATKAGHDAAARAMRSGVTERAVQTEIEHAFFMAGATGLSYPSIVGSGPNGAVLHWDQNTRPIVEGDLVVIDAAAEYGRYACDVTRTYPVSGKFTADQAKAYRAVYQAQEDIFAAVKPGVTMADLQKVAERSLDKAGYLAAFIHGFGHFVGLDVHDAGSYDQALPAGAVITVEPGVYLPEKGFGVRIEDDVLVTATGYEILTKDIPRKLEDVEAWLAKSRR